MKVNLKTRKVKNVSSSKSGFNKNEYFPVVGIGGSAGSLEVLKQFFSDIEPKLNISFVVIVHLSRDEKSYLAQILERSGHYKAKEATDGELLKPNNIYVSAPGSLLKIINGRFRYFDTQRTQRAFFPIDVFFRSLAREKGEEAICIILSGANTDATLGAREIKGHGGMVMAQAPETAEYATMPANILTNLKVDYCLSPNRLGIQLVSYVKNKYSHIADKNLNLIDNKSLERILSVIERNLGYNFRGYKINTILRRVMRKMVIWEATDIEDFISILDSSREKVMDLFHDLTIGITSFFRDEKTWIELQKKILPVLFKDKELQTLRIWVPACSSGEEAYTIAMIMKDYIERKACPCKIKILATDIGEKAIIVARAGSYPRGIEKDIPPKYLERFFIWKQDGYCIKNEIREMIVFAKHDILKNPPFSKINFISFKNLLIYLKPESQERVLSSLHYSLSENGILSIGESESLGTSSNLYKTIDSKHKFFVRKNKPSKNFINTLALGYDFPGQNFSVEENSSTLRETGSFKNEVLKILIENFRPPALVVNESLEIVYFIGKTQKYIAHSSGLATLNINEISMEELKIPLMSSVKECFLKNEKVIYKNVFLKQSKNSTVLNLLVLPVGATFLNKKLALVVFQAKNKQSPKNSAHLKVGTDMDQESERINQLQYELDVTKKDLNNTIMILRESNEKLILINEELNSANEELQSSNEEIQASKEELHSVNEELNAVNAELEDKINESTSVNDDMNNLLVGTNIACIFLDTNLDLKRFTQAAKAIIPFIDSDVGRPIMHIVPNFKLSDLTRDLKVVLKTGKAKEFEVETTQNIWYQMRILPYKTHEALIGGLVITFSDITELKKTEKTINFAWAFAENILSTIPDPFLILDKNLRVIKANDRFFKFFSIKKEKCLGMHLTKLGNQQLNIPSLEKLLKNLVMNEDSDRKHDKSVKNFPILLKGIKTGSEKVFLDAHKIFSKNEYNLQIFLLFHLR